MRSESFSDVSINNYIFKKGDISMKVKQKEFQNRLQRTSLKLLESQSQKLQHIQTVIQKAKPKEKQKRMEVARISVEAY